MRLRLRWQLEPLQHIEDGIDPRLCLALLWRFWFPRLSRFRFEVARISSLDLLLEIIELLLYGFARISLGFLVAVRSVSSSAWRSCAI